MSAKLSRKSARLELVASIQVAAYADILRVAARVVDNSRDWSFDPTADLQKTADEELDRVISQARVVASEKVCEVLQTFIRRTHEFNRTQAFLRSPHGPSMELARLADDMIDLYKILESAIRREFAR